MNSNYIAIKWEQSSECSISIPHQDCKTYTANAQLQSSPPVTFALHEEVTILVIYDTTILLSDPGKRPGNIIDLPVLSVDRAYCSANARLLCSSMPSFITYHTKDALKWRQSVFNTATVQVDLQTIYSGMKNYSFKKTRRHRYLQQKSIRLLASCI